MWLHRKREFYDFFEKKESEVAGLYARELQASQIRSLQDRKLGETLDYVRSRSKHYARVLAHVKDGLTINDLPALPFTTKDDLRRYRTELSSIPLAHCDLYCETTGTTGDAAPSPRHTYDRIWNNSNWVHGWKRVLGESGKLVGISGPSELHGMVDSFTDVYQSLGHCVAKIYPFSTKVNFAKALKTMKDLAIEVLHVTPTVALMLVSAAKVYGFDLERDFALKHIFLTGELCSAAMARNVESFWHAHTMNNPYASQEALGLSVGLEDGQLYTMPLSYAYELVDEADRPLGATGRGELVVTMLEPGARPLIRFRTGDLVELRPPTSASIIHAPVMVPLGRTRDIVNVQGRALSAHELETALLAHIDRVLSYQFLIQRGAKELELIAEIQLEEGRQLRASEREAIVEGYRSDLGVAVVVRTVTQTDPAASMGAIAGWKAARLKDLTAEPDAERAFAERAGERRKV